MGFLKESIHSIYDLIDYYWSIKVNQNMNIFVIVKIEELPDKL